MVYTKLKASKKRTRKRNNIKNINKITKKNNKNRNKITKRNNKNRNKITKRNNIKNINKIRAEGAALRARHIGGSRANVETFLDVLHAEKDNSSKKRSKLLVDMVEKGNLKLIDNELYITEIEYYKNILRVIYEHVQTLSSETINPGLEVVQSLNTRCNDLLNSLEFSDAISLKRLENPPVTPPSPPENPRRLKRSQNIDVSKIGGGNKSFMNGGSWQRGGGDARAPQYFDFKEYQKLITSYICLLLVEGRLIGDTSDWEKCNSDCISILKGFVDMETSMTFYWIKYLNECLIKSTDSSKIEITCSETLNGIWADDRGKLKIVVKSDNGDNNISGVIPVIGPSASGKTVWVVNLVKSLGEGEQKLIKHIYGGGSEHYLAGVLNIDGGIMREMTDVGRAIVDCLRSQDRSTVGISNYHGQIVNSSDIKRKLIDFLTLVHTTHDSEFMVALPDTATSSYRIGNDGVNFKNYMFNSLGISGFVTTEFIPICFYVYQHVTSGDCKYANTTFEGNGTQVNAGGFKCVGCTESGTEREKEEGKKYSAGSFNKNYKTAHRLAENIIKFLSESNTPRTLCLKIHNSGRKATVLEDGSKSGLSLIKVKRPPEISEDLVVDFLNKLAETEVEFFMNSGDTITPL